MRVKTVACVLGLLLPISVFGQSASKSKGSRSEKKYDLARATYSGEIVRGPRRVIAENLNTLRYDYKWNSSVSFQAAPDLWSKLIGVNATSPSTPAPANPSPPAKGQLAGGATIRAELQPAVDKANKLISDTDGQIKLVVDLKSDIQTDLASLQAQQARADLAAVQVANAGKALTDFLRTSNGTAAQLISGIKDQLANSDVNAAIKDSTFVTGTKARWSDQSVVAALRDASKSRGAQLDDLKTRFASYVPQQAAALEASKGEVNTLIKKMTPTGKKLSQEDRDQIDLLTQVAKSLELEQKNLTQVVTILDWDVKTNNQISTAIPDLDQSGSKYGSFRSAQDSLTTWKVKMESLQQLWDAYLGNSAEHSNPFSAQIDADCEFAFSRTKQTTITLAQTDQLPGSTSTSSTNVLSVIVECTSPFTISAGVAFSSIRQKEFAIQPVATPPGSTTTTNEFVATNNSSFHPLAIGMVHARVWEPNEKVALHASLGLAGNFQSQNSGGSSAAFLAGPSLSIFRTMFFTPGLLIAQRAQLGGGFKVGNPAPPNVTTPPLQNSYTAGFGIAITFTKP